MQPTPQQDFSLALKFVTSTKIKFMLVYYEIFWVESSLYGPHYSPWAFGAQVSTSRGHQAGLESRYVVCWVGPSVSTKTSKIVVSFGMFDDRLLIRKCKQAVIEEKHNFEMGGK